MTPPDGHASIRNAASIPAIERAIDSATAKARKAMEDKIRRERGSFSATLDAVERVQDEKVLRSSMAIALDPKAPKPTGAIKRITPEARAEAEAFLRETSPVPMVRPPG